MRQNIPSPSPYAPIIAFSAAVKTGSHIYVSGTVGRRPDGSFSTNMYDQAKQALDNIAAVLSQAGASLNDVVRTRMFVTDVSLAEDVFRAHKEAFSNVMPASTIVEISKLAADNMLIEIEVDAVVDA